MKLASLLFHLVVGLALGDSAFGNDAEIDTTRGWEGVLRTGPYIVGQSFTVASGGRALYSFDFFVDRSTSPYAGGVVRWDPVARAPIGGPLAVAQGSPPLAPNGSGTNTISGSRVRFTLPSPVLLEQGYHYLIYARAESPGNISPGWLKIEGGYGFNGAFALDAFNSNLAGPWRSTGPTGGVNDDWVFRVFLHYPDPVLPVPGLTVLGEMVLAFAMVLAGLGIILRRTVCREI